MLKLEQEVVRSKTGKWPKFFLLEQMGRILVELSASHKLRRFIAESLRECTELARTNDGCTEVLGSNPGDQGNQSIEIELNMLLEDKSVKRIAEMGPALETLWADINSPSRKREPHGYGLCRNIGCGETISVIRLRALPWATKCLVCQQKAEFLK